MLPIILGVVGAGFLVSAYSEKKEKKFAKGGSIPNNYEGKTPEQVWNEWSVEQKKHFILDHWNYKTHGIDALGGRTPKEISEDSYKNIPVIIRKELEYHISKGQYKKGGSIENTTYVPNRDIKELQLVLHGELKKIKGSQVLEGVHVKNVKGKTATKSNILSADEAYNNILAKAKKEKLDKDELLNLKKEDVSKFIDAGYDMDDLYIIYFGVKSIIDVKCDNEISSVNGLFAYSKDYLEREINALVLAVKENKFEIGLKYPDFNWASIIKKYNIKNSPIIVERKVDWKDGSYDVYVYEIFVGDNLVLGHSIKRKRYKDKKLVETIDEGTEIKDYTKITSYQKDREYKSGFNGNYWGIVSSKKSVIYDIVKTITSQEKGYVKNLEVFTNHLGGIGYEELDQDNIKYAKGGEVKDSVVKAIFYSNQKVRKGGIGKINTDFGEKTYTGLESMILNEAYSPTEIAEAIFSSNAKKGLVETGYGRKNVQGLTEMIEDARSNAYAKGGEVNDDYLLLTFKPNIYYQKAKEHFDPNEGGSNYFPAKHNDEFKTFYFEVESQDDADNLERFLTQELDELGLSEYYFENETKFAKGGEVYAKGGSIKEIALPNSNLYLYGFGRDVNGNSTIKLSFGSNRGFSIQINNPDFYIHTYPKRGYSLKELSEEDILGIEKEVVSYLQEFGSKDQKSKLKTYYEKGGNVNTGRSWHLDRAKHNKNEKWEKPMAKRKKKYAKGGNVYSSEEPYIVKVYSHSNELLDQKTIRAKSNKEANEMAEDMEDGFKKKFGNDLRIKVIEAQKMAKGGSMAKEPMKKEVKKSSEAKKSNTQTGKLKEVMAHAKATRKSGEAWKSAVARAWKEVGK